MKISELVEKLQEVLFERGDITVTYQTDDYFKDIDLVIYEHKTHGEDERVELR